MGRGTRESLTWTDDEKCQLSFFQVFELVLTCQICVTLKQPGHSQKFCCPYAANLYQIIYHKLTFEGCSVQSQRTNETVETVYNDTEHVLTSRDVYHIKI